MNKNLKKAIVIAGSRGVGKSISNRLKKLNIKTLSFNSKNLDTSNIPQVEKFIKNNKYTDILVLNTGGPPAKDFNKITKKEFKKYFNQLFLSFTLILQKVTVKKNGFVFLISSYVIKEPDPKLTISNAYRTALSSILKTYGTNNLINNITTINLALGPIYTDRLKKLNKGKTRNEIGVSLPLGRVGDPDEIADIVESFIVKDIKYLNTQTLFIDGGISKNLF